MEIKEILDYGVLIGSRAYGVNTEDSDYDIIVTEEDYYKICERNDAKTCNNIDVEEEVGGYNYSVFGSGLDDIAKFKSCDGSTVNVFVYTDPIGKVDNRLTHVSDTHIYDRFKKHNKCMLSHTEEELADRTTRIELFITYLDACGITEAKDFD